MKSFFASFFGALLALLVFCGGTALLGFVILMVIAASGEKPVEVEKGSYLVFDFTGNILDAPEQMEGLDQLREALGGGRPYQRLQLRPVVRAIEAAAKDDDIKGLYLTGNFMPEAYGSGYAALREVRTAIEAFKASGKPVRGYFNMLTTRNYYVASAADEIVLDPYGFVAVPGLASQPMFMAGAFEKLGVGVQVTRVGRYKSAVEPYTRTDMSPEFREQLQTLLDDLWGSMTVAIEDSRSLERGTFQKIVDSEGLVRADDALKHKLVDRVAYYDEVQAVLKGETGVESATKSFRQIGIKQYAKLVSGGGLAAERRDSGNIDPVKPGGGGRIAIVYAEGAIVDGKGEDEGVVWGESYAREIRKLRQDNGVKAIVLRVNSPGGSAMASEAIQRELRNAMEEGKPVVVSMGSIAASGGYWISTYSDRIFAEPSTITGSIGVFGMFLNMQELANEKLGLTFDTVKTGKFADAAAITRPKTAEELAIFGRLVDWIYEEFTSKVAESRGIPIEKVREIAEGRVWSGEDAVRLGLVDEVGGLSAAIKFAADKAGLGESFRVSEFPQRRDFAEALAESLGGKRREANAGTGVISRLVGRVHEEMSTLEEFNDPRGIYARFPFNLSFE